VKSASVVQQQKQQSAKLFKNNENRWQKMASQTFQKETPNILTTFHRMNVD